MHEREIFIVAAVKYLRAMADYNGRQLRRGTNNKMVEKLREMGIPNISRQTLNARCVRHKRKAKQLEHRTRLAKRKAATKVTAKVARGNNNTKKKRITNNHGERKAPAPSEGRNPSTGKSNSTSKETTNQSGEALTGDASTCNQTTNQTTNQVVNETANHTTNQTTNQAVNETANHTTNQTANQSKEKPSETNIQTGPKPNNKRGRSKGVNDDSKMSPEEKRRKREYDYRLAEVRNEIALAVAGARAASKPKRLPRNTCEKIIEAKKREFGLDPSVYISKKTIENRFRPERKTVAYHSGPVGPLNEIEDILIRFVREMEEATGKKLSPAECVALTNRLIDGTQHQRKLIEYKRKHGHSLQDDESLGRVSLDFWRQLKRRQREREEYANLPKPTPWVPVEVQDADNDTTSTSKP